MQVTRHTDPDAFIAAAAPMAARGEASASFFTGWAHSLKRMPLDETSASTSRRSGTVARDPARDGP